MGKILYGHELSKEIRLQLQEEIHNSIYKGIRKPSLAIVMVGNDDGAQSYVISIMKACQNIGIEVKKCEFEDDIDEKGLMKTIQDLNADDTVDGIIIQMPLPKHIDTQKIIECVDATKDVDGLTSKNVARLYMKEDGMLPCTPNAVMRILKEYGIELMGKEVVVIGRSHSVGRPVAQLLINADATVTICHSKTNHLPEVCKRADVVVVAIGRAKFVKAEWIKEDAIVIDVGVNIDENGKLCGDVDFDQVIEKANVTPVPKGVGPVTTTMLLENVIKSYKGRVKDGIQFK